MRGLAVCLGFGVTMLGVPAYAADQIINLPECQALSVDELHELAEYALTKRRYNIEENTPTLLVGEQDNLRVEFVLEPQRITIRWKEGFAATKDQWLRNLKTDVLWRLAE